MIVWTISFKFGLLFDLWNLGVLNPHEPYWLLGCIMRHLESCGVRTIACFSLWRLRLRRIAIESSPPRLYASLFAACLQYLMHKRAVYRILLSLDNRCVAENKTTYWFVIANLNGKQKAQLSQRNAPRSVSFINVITHTEPQKVVHLSFLPRCM